MRTLALFAIDHLVGVWLTVCAMTFVVLVAVQGW